MRKSFRRHHRVSLAAERRRRTTRGEHAGDVGFQCRGHSRGFGLVGWVFESGRGEEKEEEVEKEEKEEIKANGWCFGTEERTGKRANAEKNEDCRHERETAE